MKTIDVRQARMTIDVQRMEDIYDLADGQPDHPHRHDYYTVLFVEMSEGHHLIDYDKFQFRSREVHFVSPGQVHQVVLSQRPKGRVITFSKDFLVQNNISESFITNISLFQAFGHSPPLSLDNETVQKLNRVLDEMESCMPENLNYRLRALGALLQLFLIYCNNSAKLNTSQIDEDNAGVCILRDFKKLVEEKYWNWHKVKDYASELLISPKHLSQTVKNITGKVAKDHIQDRIILEAKRSLLHTGLTIKEIAYDIGFNDPLHFSSFFKKFTGLSPSAFRDAQDRPKN